MNEIPILVIDSGESVTTAKTVAAVREMLEKNPDAIQKIFDDIEKISLDGIEAMKSNDIERLKVLMDSNHELLKRLGVSTPQLDKIVKIANDSGAGAKLTGGGGGGCAIAIADEKTLNKLVYIYKKNGYNAFMAKTGAEGVRIEKSNNP